MNLECHLRKFDDSSRRSGAQSVFVTCHGRSKGYFQVSNRREIHPFFYRYFDPRFLAASRPISSLIAIL
jgi:hypothetical protein